MASAAAIRVALGGPNDETNTSSTARTATWARVRFLVPAVVSSLRNIRPCAGSGSLRSGPSSREHVRAAVRGGFCQLNHGKEAALRRLKTGDRLVPPRSKKVATESIHAFTAAGEVLANEPYQGRPSWGHAMRRGVFRILWGRLSTHRGRHGSIRSSFAQDEPAGVSAIGSFSAAGAGATVIDAKRR